MTFTATISNIDVNGTPDVHTNDNLVAAHIHAGASVVPGVMDQSSGALRSAFSDNNPNDR
jgi:hypothetical protein